MKNKYNELINSVISNLIDRKDYFVENINDIASIVEYHSYNDNVNLSKSDIETINEDRQYILAIYKLISDLDNLKK